MTGSKQKNYDHVMKAIMFTAPSSGSGKTTVTMAIVRAIKNRGYNPSCFKTGPDYIDTAFLAAASGKSAGNLDLHLQGREGMRQALSMADSDYCVIEGAMGYFDGIANTFSGSSYDLGQELGVPSVLVYTPRGEMFSAIPKIKGMAAFSGSLIKAVILNDVNRNIYLMLKEQIEKYTSLPVIGFMPRVKQSELKSRHLGLIQSLEIANLDELIETLAAQAESNIDIEALMGIFAKVKSQPFPILRRRNLVVAIARDKAFSFYYRENLKLFEDTCEVKYFSPLNDNILPICDLLYLGGGYPEIFRSELSANKTMLESVRNYANNGGFVYAECGGMNYLCDTVEGTRMVGFLKGESRLTTGLQRFGYVDICLLGDCLLGKAGDILYAHEFHRSKTSIAALKIYSVTKTRGNKHWMCGYVLNNVLAGYPHLNFIGNLDAFKHLLEYVYKKR